MPQVNILDRSSGKKRNKLCFVGILETFLTAFQGLRVIGNLQQGDVALIHAGAR